MVEFLQNNRILVSRVFVVAFFATLLFSESSHARTLTGPALFSIGLAFVGIATVGRLWCSLYISGYKDNSLITVGPYSICRNPLYLFSFIGFVGVGLATESLAIAAALALFFAVVYPFIIEREEGVLRARFGAEFDAYCATVPRFLPRFSGFVEPEQWTVRPRIFRRTMRDVIWFVWLTALIALVPPIREQALLQPWIALP